MPDRNNRRSFFKKISLAALGGMTFSITPLESSAKNHGSDLQMIGPVEGYTPHVGTLVTMLNYNRQTIVDSVTGLSAAQLDFLFDKRSNSIGALLLHLGAVEKIYQVTTFDGRNGFNEKERKEWGAALDLGDAGRKEIKGRDLKYYLQRIAEVRQRTLAELKKKDDEWLIKAGTNAGMKVNNYWKWFHVCEHESNHRGQITWLKQRLPA